MSVYIFSIGTGVVTGLARTTVSLANSLAKKNIDVALIDISVRDGQLGSLAATDTMFPLHHKVNKYSLDNLSCQPPFPFNNTIFYQIEQKFLKVTYFERHKLVLQMLNQHFDEHDLLVFTHPLALAIFAQANPINKAKTVLQIHGNYTEEQENCNLLKPYLNYVDIIQVVSAEQKAILETVEPFINFKDKLRVIYNILEPLATVNDLRKTGKIIGIIGSIQPRKNQLHAIRLLEYIKDKNIILHIYGNIADKNYYNELLSYVEGHNFQGRVVFCGVCSEQEIYATIDIAVITSQHEGFNYILMESAYYGVPCVTYDYKFGATEFTDNNKNGCLIPHGDVRSMANKIELLLSCKESYNKIIHINKDRLQQEYNKNSITDKYLELWDNANKKLNFNLLEKQKIKHIECNIKDDGISIVLDVDKSFDIENISFYYMNEDNIFEFFFTVLERELSYQITLETFRLLNTFKIYYNNNSYERQWLCSIRNGELEQSAKISNYHLNNNIVELKDISHFLQPNGFFWMRYPEFNPILYITNELDEDISYTTSIATIKGDRYFYFRITSEKRYSSLKIHMSSGNTYFYQFPKFNYKTLYETLSSVELKHNLYNFQIQGVYFYEIIRKPVFLQLLSSLGIKEREPFQAAGKNIYNGYKKLDNIPKKFNKILFQFPKKSSNGIDIKTEDIIKQITDCVVIEYPQFYGYSYQVIEQDNHYPIKDFIDWQTKIEIEFSAKEKKLISFLESIFLENIGIYIKFDLFLKQRIGMFLKQFQYFDKFFAQHKFNELMLVAAYWFSGIISAAKKHGILTSDIQYGDISKYKPHYSFPESSRHYGCDRIYLFSEYWNIPELFSYKEKIILFDNFFSRAIQDKKISKNSEILYDVAFVNQSSIAHRFFDFAQQFAYENPELKCIFLLHPSDLESIYISNVSNLLVSKGDTFYNCSQSANVVGAYSSCLIEAVALGKNTYVLTILGCSEVLERQIKEGMIRTVSSSLELAQEVKKKVNWQKPNLSSLLFNCEIPE